MKIEPLSWSAERPVLPEILDSVKVHCVRKAAFFTVDEEAIEQCDARVHAMQQDNS